ncbi:MAG TPA: site-2 protease family protein [Streptosporangiaceae bacterium]|nr:site-2 protease family protein [Streptosporangiaceae bacterium]
MSFLLGILIFILAILFSVVLHEAGHYATAKKFGMKVTQFFAGFGQTLWSTRRGETEYGIKAIPAGGFVKIVGMTNMDDVAPADEPRSFRRHPRGQRIIVLAAGSVMHFVLAFVLLFAVAVFIGQANPGTSTTVGAIDACVPANLTTPCTTSNPASPAKQAGIRAGDKIIAVAGTPVRDWTQMGKVIRSQPAGTPVAVTVERDGRQLTAHPSLAVVHGRQGSYLGISPVVVFQRSGPLGGIGYAGSQFGQIVSSSAGAVASLPRAIPDLFAKNRADTPAGNVGSLVGAADTTGQVVAAPISWQARVSVVLLIVASLNIWFGLLNLLPLLPLDGGHIAVVIYEQCRAWLARLRGRPDPGLVDYRRLIPVSVGVLVLLIGFSLLLITADLVNPVHIIQ